jgi:hypothetical protein
MSGFKHNDCEACERHWNILQKTIEHLGTVIKDLREQIQWQQEQNKTLREQTDQKGCQCDGA